MQRPTEELNVLAQGALCTALTNVIARVRKGDYRGAARMATLAAAALKGMDACAKRHEKARAGYDSVRYDCTKITASDEEDEK